MKIEKTINGMIITHDTGVKQVLTKEELQAQANIIQSQIDELESQKTQMQSDVDEITNLQVKSL